MPIPAGFARAVLHGTQGTDVFETGVWVTNAPADQAAAQTLANALWNLWLASAVTGLVNVIPPDCSYTGLRLYCYPAGGPKAQFIAEAVANPAPGNSGSVMPYQVAMCVTLLTGAAGRRARGRMFIPASGGSLDAAHMFIHEQVNEVGTAIAGWLTGMQAGASKPVVLSTTDGSSRPIVATDCDNKPDIQRRRANKVVGTYTRHNTLG
jgi:hypothetical protein